MWVQPVFSTSSNRDRAEFCHVLEEHFFFHKNAWRKTAEEKEKKTILTEITRTPSPWCEQSVSDPVTTKYFFIQNINVVYIYILSRLDRAAGVVTSISFEGLLSSITADIFCMSCNLLFALFFRLENCTQYQILPQNKKKIIY